MYRFDGGSRQAFNCELLMEQFGWMNREQIDRLMNMDEVMGIDNGSCQCHTRTVLN